MKIILSILIGVVILFTSLGSDNLFIMAQVDNATTQDSITNLTTGPAGPAGLNGTQGEVGTVESKDGENNVEIGGASCREGVEDSGDGVCVKE